MVFTEKQQYELLASISARGEIPTKFVYLNGGDKFWDDVYIERSKKEGMANKELDLLLGHIDSFINVFKNAQGVNLVDLGCGNGTPAIAIIERLRAHNFKVNYIAVDISADMLDLAANNVSASFADTEIKKLHIDFEKESLINELLDIKQQTRFPNLMVDLGNTLGNHVNINAVLTNFLESMTLEDYLIIGNGLANDYNPQKILESYTDTVKKMITHPAALLGLYDDDDEFKFIWNDAKNRVEARIKFTHDKTLTLANQEIRLEAGEELLVMQSNKYSEFSLTKLLSDTGFRTELLTTTKTRDEILAMVQPTRFSVG